MTGKQLDQIEETLAHQDRQIQDLSDMIIYQGKDIESLKLHIRKLEARLRNSEYDDQGDDGKAASGIEFAAENKPPHY